SADRSLFSTPDADRPGAQGAHREGASRRQGRGRGPDRRRRPLPGGGGVGPLPGADQNRAAPPRLRCLRSGDRGPDPRALAEDLTTTGDVMTNEKIREFIQTAIDENRVMLFMKGTPEQPACGFSMRTSGALNELGVQYAALDILPDPRIRQELSAISNWPTIPQLFVDGELIGGCDIVTEMYETGELAERLGVPQPQAEPEAPTVDAPQSAPLGIENRLS